MEGSLTVVVEEGIALARIDVQGSAVNAVSAALLDELEALLDDLAHDDSVGAVIIASGKPGSFVAGADLREISAMTRPGEAEAFARRAHGLLDRIASSGKPFVAAIHGAALGGGLELALACQGRVATSDPRTVLALPEVSLGLIPAAGGTQRLPRLIGLARALPMLLAGQRVRAERALAIGLIDRIASESEILEAAHGRARELLETPKRWTPGSWSERLRSPAPRSRISIRDRMALARPIRSLILRKAGKLAARKARGHYPAPAEILEAVRIGLEQGYGAGQQQEISAFGRLVVSPQAKNLLRLFDLSTARRKPSPAAAAAPARIGVVGAGLMGKGIASVSLDFAAVVLEDLDPERLRIARGEIEESIAKRVLSGSLTAEQGEERLGRLVLATEPGALRDCDLVIEAVFEDLELKRRLFTSIESVIAENAVLASNTSAIPIAGIATALRRPERVVGMHYFSPVPKMPLVEIVVPRAAAEWAVERARAAAIAQGKVVILVNDGPGFYTTRILAPYLNEAMLLLEEGAEPEALEETMREFGFPVGPLTLLDEVGLDVAAHVSRDLGRAFAALGHRSSAALDALVAAGLVGRKSGNGFFLYRKGRKGAIDPRVGTLIGAGKPPGRIARDAIRERLVLAMVNEAARALDEGTLGGEDDGDLGAILGLGFPAFRGGPFAWSRAEGVGVVADRLLALASMHGKRFEPARWFAQGRDGH